MKVIVNTIHHLGSPMETYVYTSDDIHEAMKRMYKKDLEYYGKDIDEEQTYIDKEGAQVYAESETSYYEILEVKEI